jgi:hypothetical protein
VGSTAFMGDLGRVDVYLSRSADRTVSSPTLVGTDPIGHFGSALR